MVVWSFYPKGMVRDFGVEGNYDEEGDNSSEDMIMVDPEETDLFDNPMDQNTIHSVPPFPHSLQAVLMPRPIDDNKNPVRCRRWCRCRFFSSLILKSDKARSPR
jgi:hypothetical protein